MKNMASNLKTYFLNNANSIKDRYKNDRFGLLLFLTTYFIVGITILTLPIFTYHKGFTMITNILSIASVISIALFLIFRGKFHINYFVIYMALFVIYSLVLTLFTTKSLGFGYSKTLLTSHAFAVALFILFAFTDDYKYFFSIIFGSFFILAAYFVIFYAPGLIKGGISGERLGEELGNVNNVGMTFCFAIIFCLFLTYKYRGKAYFLLIPAFIFTGCLVLTASRGAYIVLAVVLIVFLYLFIGKGNLLIYILSLVSLFCLLFLILQIPELEAFRIRFYSLFTAAESPSSADRSTLTRMNMFIDGLRLWTRELFIGHGVGGFKENTAYPYYSHNTISEVLANTGIIGAVLFFYPYVRTSYLNFKKGMNKPLFTLFVVILIASFVNLFQDIIFYNKISILIWVLIATYTFSFSKKKQYVATLSFIENKKFKPSFKVHLSEKDPESKAEQIKPNIAFVITRLSGGGAERVASILCSEWANLGYNVTLILTSFNQNESQNYEISDKVDVRALCKNKKLTSLGKAIKINKIFKEKEINTCVTFLSNSYILARLASFRLRIHHVFSIRINPESRKDFKRKFAINSCEAIVCQTKEIDQYFDKKGYKKSLVIKNPVTTEIIPSENDKNKFVAVGRLSGQKNFAFLIESFGLYALINPEASLTIYGSGKDEEMLREMIIDFNLEERIKIIPFTNDIKEKINQYGIYCSTSTYEGFSNSMLEATQAGLPIVSLDCAGGCAKEMIKDNGVLLPLSASTRDFCMAMDKIYKNYETYRKTAVNRVKTINEEYNSKAIAQEWIELFEYILN